jgi:hypothetical protein
MYGAMTLMILIAVLALSIALGWGAALGVLRALFRMLEIFQSASSARQNTAAITSTYARASSPGIEWNRMEI